MNPLLGRLEPVGVRDVWPHEASDFTRWLLQNADHLGDALGLGLTLEAAEHRVGEFSLDLMGRDAEGRIVIIENQLEKSDHDHLGKLLTYAGGTDAAVVVWIAPAFREPHRQTIDWLNRHTDEGIHFFAVEVSAVRIDDSKPAALFQVVARPDGWTKEVARRAAASPESDTKTAYTEFWAELLAQIRVSHPDWTSARTSRDNYVVLPYAGSKIWYQLMFAREGLRVELYFGSNDAAANHRAFHRALALSEQLEKDFGRELHFDDMPDKIACRIQHSNPGDFDVLDRESWEGYMEWMVSTFEKFRPATQVIRPALLEEY